MSVYKRQDRKRRPWCFEFRENGTLYKQSGFGTMKAAQDAAQADLSNRAASPDSASCAERGRRRSSLSAA